MLDAFWTAPPVSRTLTALVLLVSVSCYGGLLDGRRIIFAWPLIWKLPPEIWRFFTAFFISGPQIAIIFDPYTIWRYASVLETESPRFTEPGNFLTYILFVGTFIANIHHHLCTVGMSIEKTHVIKQFAFCGLGSLQVLRRQLYSPNSSKCIRCIYIIFSRQRASIVALLTFLKLTANYLLGSVIFTGGLITAILYTYAQENRGKKVKFMIITMDVKWLPWAYSFLNFVINGVGSTKIMIVGIVAAHLYDFLTRLWPAFGGGSSIVWTPTFISNIFGGPRRVTVAKHGTVFRPPTQSNSTYTSGWGSRGQGRRLGGE